MVCDPEVGEREGAVARKIMDDAVDPVPLSEFDPNESKWDGIVPLEKDPLSHLRILASRLTESINLYTEVACQAPFIPVD